MSSSHYSSELVLTWQSLQPGIIPLSQYRLHLGQEKVFGALVRRERGEEELLNLPLYSGPRPAGAERFTGRGCGLAPQTVHQGPHQAGGRVLAQYSALQYSLDQIRTLLGTVLGQGPSSRLVGVMVHNLGGQVGPRPHPPTSEPFTSCWPGP